MYNEIQTCVSNNGNFTDWFAPQRGIRQRCPASAYLFILAVEVMASRIKNNDVIKGLKVNNGEIIIIQL